jgi:hypothetical protein
MRPARGRPHRIQIVSRVGWICRWHRSPCRWNLAVWTGRARFLDFTELPRAQSANQPRSRAKRGTSLRIWVNGQTGRVSSRHRSSMLLLNGVCDELIDRNGQRGSPFTGGSRSQRAAALSGAAPVPTRAGRSLAWESGRVSGQLVIGRVGPCRHSRSRRTTKCSPVLAFAAACAGSGRRASRPIATVHVVDFFPRSQARVRRERRRLRGRFTGSSMSAPDKGSVTPPAGSSPLRSS